jgi:hypothetical protein
MQTLPSGFYHFSFLDGRLIGSEHPAALGHSRQIVEYFAQRRGVRVLITLTTDFERFGIPELRQYHVPITAIPSHEQVEQAVAVIGQHLAIAEPVWVNCQQGLDRTGCIIGCYLTTLGQSADTVIEAVHSKFPPRRLHPRFVQLWQPYADVIRAFSRRRI